MKTILIISSALLVCISMGIAQEDAHWPLDTNVEDALGYFHGEMTPNGVSFADDPIRGKVMLLDGVSGYVTLPLGLLDFVQDVTITCWFNWAGGGNWQRVYSFGNSMPNVRTLYLCPRDGWVPNKLHITLGGQPPNGAFTWKDFMPDSIETNTWYFSAFILKGDSLKFYLNDDLVVNEGDVLVDPEDLIPDSANYIGRSHWPDPTYNGMIDDLRFYPYAFSPEEVIALYETPVNVNVPEKTVQQFILNQNYPNPFNPATKISYSIPKASFVTLKIFDLLGREISTLVNEFQRADTYNVNFDASDIANGIYIYQLKINNEFIKTKRMVLLR
ncbi:hypothetical protein A2V82_02690 [candidate division KSB1 bacterium RBG_16_48_16]|nr:MAG: hypothetical protein A2V82_02690 [candidate division KSB1 bacterium RBG_16_48_16]